MRSLSSAPLPLSLASFSVIQIDVLDQVAGGGMNWAWRLGCNTDSTPGSIGGALRYARSPEDALWGNITV